MQVWWPGRRGADSSTTEYASSTTAVVKNRWAKANFPRYETVDEQKLDYIAK